LSPTPLPKTTGPIMTALTDSIRFNLIIFRDRVFTKEYMVRAIDACARYLDKNIRSNSPVVYLVAPNHIKTIIGFLAIIKTGRTALLVDPKVGKIEYEEMLADTTPSAILRIDRQTIEFDYDKEVELTGSSMDPSLVAQLDDVAVMLYTAAEDGYAKAAMLTHRNLLSNAQVICEDNHVDASSTSCALLPFHHIFGFQYGVITPLIGYGSLLVIDNGNAQRIDLIAEEISRHKTTQIYSIPLMYYLLSKSPAIRDISKQVHSLICGGYQLAGFLKSRFEQKCGIPLLEGYGLTETSAGCLWQQWGEKYANGSVGRAVRNCRVKIFDEANNEVHLNEKGEICVQGDNITKGYFNRPEATCKTIINGWLHTGDYGKQNENGDVFFLGCKKSMYNVGGNKVYPEEVIKILKMNPNVETVEFRSEYDELTGDRIRAWIKLSDTSQKAIAGFKEWCFRGLTPHKVPQFVFVS
jgi:long-chain acyl-CoA synthetase